MVKKITQQYNIEKKLLMCKELTHMQHILHYVTLLYYGF